MRCPHDESRRRCGSGSSPHWTERNRSNRIRGRTVSGICAGWRREVVSHPLRGSVAIVGVGNTKRWNGQGRTAFDQLQEAALIALEDCGLRTKDVDGLFTAMSISGLPVLNVAERLGIRPLHADGTMVGGASFLFHVQSAIS